MADVPGGAPTAPAAPKPFDADAAVASYLADPQPEAGPALKASVYGALDTKPDYEADLRRASAATGVPLAAARGDADYVKRQAQALSLGLDGLVQTAPATTRFLSNPDNAKIAHDDTDVMAGLEKTLTGPSHDTNWLGHSLASGLHTLAGTALILAQKGVDVLSGSSEEVDLADLGSSADPAKRALAERMAQDKPKDLTERMMFGLEHGLSRASLGQFTAAGMSGAAANAALPPGAQNRVYATTDPSKSAFLSPSRLGSDLLQNTPTFLALAVTAKLAGAQGVNAETEALAAGATAEQAAAARIAATTAAMAKVGAVSEGAIGYAQQSGQTAQQMAELTPDVLAKSKGYKALIDVGFEPDVAKVILADSVANEAGAGAGLADFSTNLIGGAALGHIIGEGGPWLARILKGGATEGIQEAVQSPLEQVSQNAAMQRADPNQKLGTGLLEQALQGLALGGLMGGPTAGIAGAGGRSHAKADAAQAAVVDAINLQNLATLSEASKLRGRDVATFQGFVANAAKDGPVENVWLSTDGLKQSGVDPLALAEASPAVAAQINEARGTGGDIQIPVEQFATLPPELAQGLIPHLKTDPTGMSQFEAEHFMQNFGPELKANVEQALAEQAKTVELKASADKVRAKVLDQLTTANRFTHDVNAAYADLTAAFYTTQAQRLGVTPEALFESHPVNIAAQGVTDGSLTAHVEQPVYHGTPHEFDAFDSSKIGTGEGNQMYGHGLYFAGNKEVAEYYRNSLAGKDNPKVQVAAAKALGVEFGAGPEMMAFDAITKAKSLEEFRTLLDEHIKRGLTKTPDSFAHNEALTLQRGLNNGKLNKFYTDNEKSVKGRLLHVEIPEDHEYLNWDKPLSEQSPHVQEALAKLGVAPEPGARFVPTPGFDMRATAEKLFGTRNLAELTSAQAKELQDAAGSMVDAGHTDPTGEDIYDRLSEEAGPEAASKALHEAGIAGIRYLDGSSRATSQALRMISPEESTSGKWVVGLAPNGPNQYFDNEAEAKAAMAAEQAKIKHNYVVFDASRAKITGFEQSNGQPRGSYNPDTDLITLLRGADLSTFLHESGHFYLETLARLASDPTAPEGLREDMAKALAFIGHPDMSPAEWLAQPLDARREGHEKFARAFEQYLMEGKAPSQELRGLFQRFRAWLTTIYQQLTALRVELTPDVRAVFYRLIASEDQIAENEKAHSYGLMPDLQGHMTPDQWQEYQRLGAQATADAVDNLQTKSLRDMQWLSGARDRMIRQLQRDANTKRKAIRSEVEAEVNAEPINQARAFLKHGMLNGQEQEGPTKLSLPDLRDMYGEAPTALEETTGQKLLKVDYRKLGYGKYGMLAEDGLHPDHVAELFGFSSGDELVKTLLSAEPAADKIHGVTDQRMLERYGDLSDGPSIEKAADEALHNDARLRFVATEANALAKAVGKRKVLVSAAKSFAAEIIGRLAVREIRPSRYSAAEARAAVNAEKAAKAGNLVEAATEKRNQLVNGYAAKAAYDAIDEVAKAVRYFARFDNAGTRKALAPEYRDQIDALLERFEFKPATTLKELARRKSLASWITGQEEKGFDPVIPDDLRNEAFAKSYKDMTLDELRGLRDSVENIAHLGRLKNKLLAAQDARDFAATIDDATAEVMASAIGKSHDKVETNQLADKIAGGVRGYAVAHRKFDSLIHRLAGLEDGTTLWNVLVRPKNAASDKEAAMQEANLRAVHELFTRTGVAMDRTRQKTFIPEIGTSLSLEGRLAVALNWGNQGNRARIMDGDHWSPAQVEAILQTLEPRHFEFVQGMWDHISSFKPEIAAKERRINGVEPEFVEPTPFTVQASDGSQVEMRGGYYPIDYDPDRSAKADEHDLADMVKRAFTGTTTRATTARGHLKARVDEVTNRPVKKTFGVAFAHLNDVIHDLSWHEYLIDANRLLGNETLANAIRVSAGPEILRSLKSAIRAMAAGDMPAQNAFEGSVNYLRSGATVAGLGWNFLTALQQPLGIMNGAARIGPKWMGAGLKRWIGDAVAMENTVKWVHAQSEFMRLRGEGSTLSRELYDVRGKLTVAASADLLKATVGGKAAANIGTGLSAVEGSFYYFIGKMQMVADIPTWLGQYEKSMSLDADEKRAIAMADQAVRDSQGAGQIGDLAELQRGGPLMKIWTNFMSYFITIHNQLAESVERVQMKGVSALPLLASDVLLIGILPSVLGNSLRKLATGDDDWASWPADLAKGLMGDFFGMFVGLRDIAAAVTDGKDAPAGMRILQNTAQLATQIKQGQADDAFWKALNTEGGILLHYPAAQVQKTVLGMQALASGQTHNPLAILSGPPPKPH